MDLEWLLAELERCGETNDAQAKERHHKFLNITRDTGEFLAVLVKATKAEDILEIGTSNGYSTLWLAASLPATGKVTTLEILAHKREMARRNFERAALSHKVELLGWDARDYFRHVNERQFDIVFLDAERRQYMDFAPELIAVLRNGGLLICDNALSHASELKDFVAFIKRQRNFTTALVAVGKGEFIACKDVR